MSYGRHCSGRIKVTIMKMFVTGAVTALFSFGVLSAQELKPNYSVLLYPKGQDVDRGIVENGRQITYGPLESNGLIGGVKVDDAGRFSNVGDEARLDIYIPENCNGQLIVNTPGGGYGIVSMFNEGLYAAQWCVSHGIAICNVLYRLPNAHHAIPLRDVQNAFRYCRAHAAEWGIKQIGIMGYSAGGHLAATASNFFTDEVTRPDFSVLIYPVIDLTTDITHKWTMKRLTGEDPALKEHYSMHKRVSPSTPVTFLALSADDKGVSPLNSILYFEALLKNGVPAEMYIFPKGGHGWGFTTSEYGTDRLEECRVDFFSNLERFLNSRRAEIK